MMTKERFEIKEEGQKIVLKGMREEEWRLLSGYIFGTLDEWNFLQEGSLTTEEFTAQVYYSMEGDPLEIEMGRIVYEDCLELEPLVVFTKNFFELFIIHIARELDFYSSKIRTLTFDPNVLEIFEDKTKHQRFWDIAHMISRAWPYPNRY